MGEVTGSGWTEAAIAPLLGGSRALRTRVETIAGDGLEGYVDDVATAARFNCPRDLALDAAGNLFVVDTGNHRIRMIAPDGRVSTVAGDGVAGYLDGSGPVARFAFPRAVALDAAGNLYVADTDNDRIRKIDRRDPASPVVSTLSGGGTRGWLDGTRAVAQFYHPNGVALDAAGNVYVADASNRVIRKVSPGGTATTLAGDGVGGYCDALGAEARFNSPRAVDLDAAGNLYVAEFGNSRIRKVTPAGLVTTLAGDGRGAYRDGLGAEASFKDPCGIAVDAGGHVYVADSENHCIRRIDATGLVTTLAGGGQAIGDYADGSGAEARFSTPRGLCLGPEGVLYVADTMNHCIRRITWT